MKKIMIAALLAAATHSALAQPTLTAVSSNPVIGNVYIGHNADTTGKGHGASGAAVLWDFTTLTETGRDTTAYLSCAATPYCDSFAGSNIVAYRHGGYEYAVSSSRYKVIGLYQDDMALKLTDPQEPLRYPVTFNSAYKDTIISVIPGVMPIDIVRVDSTVADGYGTLKLPSGIYTNVLRLHTTSLNRVSVTLPDTTFSEETREEQYTWYTPGFHVPLLTISYDTSGGHRHITGATWNTRPATASIAQAPGGEMRMAVFPNPATDNIHLQFAVGEAQQVQVTISDLAGSRLVEFHEQARTGSNDLYLPLPELPAGMYILTLITNTQTAVEKMIVSN